MNLGGHTATGPRDANEDNYYVVDFSEVRSFTNGVTSFVMVSDGMGGYQGGDVASGLAVASAESYIGQLLDMAAENQIELDAEYALNEISQNAHEAILAEARERGGASMGATFVGAFLSPTHAWIGHVGDSRAYLVRGGEVTQITEDHSQVGRMLSRGLITEEEAQSHPARNRIERALGFSDATPEMNEVDLQPGDALLLCSDGVYTVLGAEAIGECVAGSRNAESASTRVVKSALSRGTDDNSTAVVALNVEERPAKAAMDRGRRQPTMRTSVDARELRTATGRFRAVEHQAGKRPSVKRLSSGKRPAWAVAIPIVVIAVLAAALAFVFLSAGVQGGGGEASAPEQEAPGSPDDQQGGASSMSSSASTPPGSSASTFTVGQGAVLKYVDAHGTAQRFSYEPFNASDVSLSEGASVVAETVASSYGRESEGQSYHALAGTYLTDLLNDCATYDTGATSFDSTLSRAIDSSSYLSFLEELSRTGGSMRSANIAKLVIDEDCLLQQP